MNSDLKDPQPTSRSIQEILVEFARLNSNDQAWIMATLLDFADKNYAEFFTLYGSIVIEKIEDLRGNKG